MDLSSNLISLPEVIAGSNSEVALSPHHCEAPCPMIDFLYTQGQNKALLGSYVFYRHSALTVKTLSKRVDTWRVDMPLGLAMLSSAELGLVK